MKVLLRLAPLKWKSVSEPGRIRRRSIPKTLKSNKERDMRHSQILIVTNRNQ